MLVGLIAAIISVIVVINHQLIWLLAIFPGLYIVYAFFITFSKAPALRSDIRLTASEKEAWEQHHTFLRFPSAAMGMSHTLSLLQFISVALAIALLVSGLYWGIIFALFWSLGLLVPRLNPTTTYVPAAQKGDRRAIIRVQALQSLKDKLDASSKES